PCLRASVSLFDFEKSHVLFLAADFDGLQTIPDTPISLNEFGLDVIDVLRQDRPWFTNDMLQESQVTDMDKRLAHEHGIHAWLSLPLLSKGQLIGALNLGRGIGQSFTTEDSDVAREVEDQIAIVLQRNRLFEETQRQMHEQKLAEEKLRRQTEHMSALYDIGLSITSKLNLNEIFDQLFEKCRNLLPIDTFSVAMYDESTHLITYPLFYDSGEYLRPLPRDIREDPGLSGHVVTSHNTLYVPDITTQEAKDKYKIIFYGGIPSRSYVGVPMFFQARVIGLIAMQNTRPDIYSPDQIRLFETIA